MPADFIRSPFLPGSSRRAMDCFQQNHFGKAVGTTERGKLTAGCCSSSAGSGLARRGFARGF